MVLKGIRKSTNAMSPPLLREHQDGFRAHCTWAYTGFVNKRDEPSTFEGTSKMGFVHTVLGRTLGSMQSRTLPSRFFKPRRNAVPHRVDRYLRPKRIQNTDGRAASPL